MRARLRAASWPLLTITVGAIGGIIAAWLSIPLGWLIGAMIFTGTLCCFYDQARVPVGLRYLGQTVIGLSAGLSLTPVLLSHALTFTPYILGGVFISIGLGLALSCFLARAAYLDPTTAFFASVPGGVAEMSNLAERYGGDVAAVAIAQTLRIFMAVLTVPLLARFFGHAAGHSATVATGILATPGLLALLAALAALLSWIFMRRRIPNAWLLGAMAVGAGAALMTATRFSVPSWSLDLAQILIGTSLGARLRRKALRSHRRLLPATIASTALLLAGNLVFGLILVALTGAGLTTAILSTSPGGLAEMSLTAIALKADISLVVAFHLARTLIVALSSLPLYAATRRLSGYKASP
jgi:membrane AbrB-like protein